MGIVVQNIEAFNRSTLFEIQLFTEQAANIMNRASIVCTTESSDSAYRV
jgi:hypothetical protein